MKYETPTPAGNTPADTDLAELVRAIAAEQATLLRRF